MGSLAALAKFVENFLKLLSDRDALLLDRREHHLRLALNLQSLDEQRLVSREQLIAALDQLPSLTAQAQGTTLIS